MLSKKGLVTKNFGVLLKKSFSFRCKIHFFVKCYKNFSKKGKIIKYFAFNYRQRCVLLMQASSQMEMVSEQNLKFKFATKNAINY